MKSKNTAWSNLDFSAAYFENSTEIQEKINKMFHKDDSDGDEMIGFKEFLAKQFKSISEPKSVNGKTVVMAFCRIANEDGKINIKNMGQKDLFMKYLEELTVGEECGKEIKEIVFGKNGEEVEADLLKFKGSFFFYYT